MLSDRDGCDDVAMVVVTWRDVVEEEEVEEEGKDSDENVWKHEENARHKRNGHNEKW